MAAFQILSEGIPQALCPRGKDRDPHPNCPGKPKHHQTPSHGLEGVGWYIENQKLRKAGQNAKNRRVSYLEISVQFSSVVSDSCDPMDWSPPGSSVNGIFQARILERVAISFSPVSPNRELSMPTLLCLRRRRRPHS